MVKTPKKPPKIKINILTSTASAKPSIGDNKISDNLAPTVPLPLTISSPTKLAFGRRCDNIPSKKIKIKIIEKADKIVFLLLAINYLQ